LPPQHGGGIAGFSWQPPFAYQLEGTEHIWPKTQRGKA